MDADRQRLVAILPNKFTNTKNAYSTPPFHFPLLDVSSPMELGCPQFVFTVLLTCQAFSPSSTLLIPIPHLYTWNMVCPALSRSAGR